MYSNKNILLLLMKKNLFLSLHNNFFLLKIMEATYVFISVRLSALILVDLKQINEIVKCHFAAEDYFLTMINKYSFMLCLN